MRNKIYISGPMTGRPDFNYPAFFEAERRLREAGWEPVNPARNFGGDTTRHRSEYMRMDIANVVMCDAIALLPGWRESRGALLEAMVAQECGLLAGELFPAAAAPRTYCLISLERVPLAQMLANLQRPTQEGASVIPDQKMRNFGTGATRNVDENKFDYEGFLSPLALEAYAAYMHTHRKQADGRLRDSDNWQKGIPRDSYMKSGWRHFFDWWKGHRGLAGEDATIEALCALFFNVQGYLHELLKARRGSALRSVGLARPSVGNAA